MMASIRGSNEPENGAEMKRDIPCWEIRLATSPTVMLSVEQRWISTAANRHFLGK